MTRTVLTVNMPQIIFATLGYFIRPQIFMAGTHVNKLDLIVALSQQHGLTKPEATRVVERFFPLQFKEVLIKTQDRFRQPEQLNLYHPPRRLPQWKELPSEDQQNVIDLMVQMFCDHYHRIYCIAKHGEVEDE